jgi:cellulose synthase/poly-beta-1,6-N-acetylglucosamine synthase-like glycosyltransferase
MVVLCLVFDTANLASECAVVYLYGVTHWGDKSYLQDQHWPMSVHLLTTSLTAFVVQCFLIRRYYHIAGSAILSALMFLLAFGSFGGAFTTCIVLYTDEVRAGISLPIWLGFSAVTDCLIATSLVVVLLRMQSGLKSTER